MIFGQTTDLVDHTFNFASIALILSSFETPDELHELAMLRPFRDSLDPLPFFLKSIFGW